MKQHFNPHAKLKFACSNSSLSVLYLPPEESKYSRQNQHNHVNHTGCAVHVVAASNLLNRYTAFGASFSTFWSLAQPCIPRVPYHPSSQLNTFHKKDHHEMVRGILYML